MHQLTEWIPLLNLAIIPAVVALFKLVRALDRIEAFMEASTADRKKLHEQIDRIERPLIAKGIIQ